MQSKDLCALSEDGELGMMQELITITHNDHVPELLSVIRRGPFAKPTESETADGRGTARTPGFQRGAPHLPPACKPAEDG